MKKSQILFTLLLIIFSLSNSSAQNHTKIPPEKPVLIIGIVIDQMRYDYIYRFWDKYSEGGIKRMVQGGTFCKNASYNFLINETAVGHATISTGALPSCHGIISNNWYVGLQDKTIYCVEDDRVTTVGGGNDAGRYSPRWLLASTLGDELKLANNFRSKVMGIALDNSAAILSAGHTADYAFWFDTESGNWITSSYYVDSLPGWVEEFNEKRLAETYLERVWDPLLPLADYTESGPDTSELETGLNGRSVFPYDLKKISTPRRRETDYNIIKYTPFGNALTKDLAIAAIVNEELGKDEYTDILMIGFSVSEYIGQAFGSNSVEMEDAILRLDRELEHFFSFIDEYIGKENTLIYLTADHGLAYNPTYLEEHRIPAGVFDPNAALTLLASYLNIVYGRGNWIKYYYAQQLYLNHELIEDARIPVEEFQEKVVLFLLQFKGVSNAVSAHTLQTTNFSDGIFRNIQNGYHQKRSGDVIINLAPGWTEKNYNSSSYHSSYVGDNHVPLLFYGWKINRETINRPVNLMDIVTTLAYFLDISKPNAAMGEIILEMVE
jgi:predicted AlkP superfamily pyrophosphatase or phosphodiesterase